MEEIKQVLGPRQEAFVIALESGNFKQGRKFLRSDDAFCCLGVACELAGLKPEHTVLGFYKYNSYSHNLPKEAQYYFNFKTSLGDGNGINLANLNDAGHTF